MLLHCRLVVVASVFFSICSSLAIPIHQQAPFQLTSDSTVVEPTQLKTIIKVPSTSYIESYKLLDTLDNYYHPIVEKVVGTTIKEVKETARETFLTIHELQWIGREHCRISVNAFTDLLSRELDRQVKNNLLISVQPLLQTFYSDMSIPDLNNVMSQQLGLLLNPEQVSKDIIKQLYHHENQGIFTKHIRPLFDKKWAQTIHHEKNEFFALEAWLRSWLMDVETLLKDEFDAKIPIKL